MKSLVGAETLYASPNSSGVSRFFEMRGRPFHLEKETELTSMTSPGRSFKGAGALTAHAPVTISL